LAEEAAAAGVTPLQVLLDVMRQHFAAGRWEEAVAVAVEAAPYVHPKLTAISHEGTVGVKLQIVEEIVDAPASVPAAA
jgi:hypothetical protein